MQQMAWCQCQMDLQSKTLMQCMLIQPTSMLFFQQQLDFFSAYLHNKHQRVTLNHGEILLPSNVKSALYKSGRRSRKTPQLCLLDLILSRSNSATRTASALSSAATRISPAGPVHQVIIST